MEPLILLASIVGGVLLLAVIVAIVLKNGLIAKDNQIDNAFSTVDVMLKKRFDLIPQLISCVQGYMQHEADLLTRLTELRSVPREAEALAASNAEFHHQLQQFILKAEAYPDLKASEQFLNLQRNITEAEEQLAAARRTYNMAVQVYNNAVLQFPSSVIARRNGFEKKTYFQFND